MRELQPQKPKVSYDLIETSNYVAFFKKFACISHPKFSNYLTKRKLATFLNSGKEWQPCFFKKVIRCFFFFF